MCLPLTSAIFRSGKAIDDSVDTDTRPEKQNLDVDSPVADASEMSYGVGTIPWFGAPSKNFSGAVRKRFKHGSNSAPSTRTIKRSAKRVARRVAIAESSWQILPKPPTINGIQRNGAGR